MAVQSLRSAPNGSRSSQLGVVDLFNSRIGHWVAMALLALLVHAVVFDLTRYFLWDEAVFFSQSGGFGRAQGPPLSMAPSREPGTPALIAALRFLGASLVGVRLGWAVVTLGLGAGAFAMLEDRIGRSGATVGFVAWAGSWLTIVHSSMLYGFAVAIGGLLLALAAALILPGSDGRRRMSLAGAIVLGVVVAMLMRPFDAWIGVVVVGVYLMVASVRGRFPLRWVVGIVGTSIALWVGGMWTRAVWSHGSPGSYLVALRDQLGGTGSERGFDLRSFGLGLVGAESGSFREALPQWAVWMTVAGLAVLVLAFVVHRAFDWAVVALGLGGAIAYGVFVVVFPFQGQGDKYLTWVVPFVAVAMAGSLQLLDADAARRRWVVALAAFGVLLAGVGGIGSADAFADRLVPRLDAGERVATTMNTVAENEACRGAARYNTPALQVGSGCSFSLVGSIERLEEWLVGTEDEAIPRFVYWAGVPEDVGVEGWLAVESAEGLGYFLWLEQPDEVD